MKWNALQCNKEHGFAQDIRATSYELECIGTSGRMMNDDDINDLLKQCPDDLDTAHKLRTAVGNEWQQHAIERNTIIAWSQAQNKCTLMEIDIHYTHTSWCAAIMSNLYIDI